MCLDSGLWEETGHLEKNKMVRNIILFTFDIILFLDPLTFLKWKAEDKKKLKKIPSAKL